MFVDEYAFVGIPAEFFVEVGLRVKEKTYPQHTLIVSCANGMVGHAPRRRHSCAEDARQRSPTAVG